MKKYVLKATALAIGALAGGSAVAAITAGVNFDASSPTVKKYAKELTYNSTTPLAAIDGINVTTKLGFGVSNNQTRYIRVDYSNAVLHTAHTAVAGTDIEISDRNSDAYAVVQGGAAGDNYVIYQVTAGTDFAAGAIVDIKTPSLRVTSTASPVAVTYSLHETAVSAVAGSAGAAKLYTKTQNIVTFASGLVLKVEASPTTTASVEQSFLKFKTGGGYITDTTAKLGAITFDVDADVAEHDGSGVDITDLLAGTGTKLVITGDLGIPAGSNDAGKKASVYISSTADCNSVGSTASTTVPNATGASFTTDANTVANKGLCYVVNGTSAISASTYSIRADVVAASGASTASIADKAIGTIARDGTELQAPFATIYGGTGNRAVLTSTHSSDVAVAASVITEDGVTCSGGTSSFTLKAGKQLFINSSEVCPVLSAGTRFAMKFIIAAPNSKITGVYNSYTYDAATGKVTDLSSYPLQRPAN